MHQIASITKLKRFPWNLRSNIVVRWKHSNIWSKRKFTCDGSKQRNMKETIPYPAQKTQKRMEVNWEATSLNHITPQLQAAQS